MKAHIIVRLVMHILVLVGLLAFFAMFPAMLPGVFLGLLRLDLLVKSCAVNAAGCLGYAGFWVVIIVGILALVLDIRMLRNSAGVEGRLWRSLALELLLPAGWWATMSSLGRSDIVGPAWLLCVGPPIMLSAIASAVVAWALVAAGLRAALGAARLWIERVLALVLTLVGGALAYLFADLLLSQF